MKRIVDYRMKHGAAECRVKWLGYDKRHNTWELEQQLRDVQELPLCIDSNRRKW